MMRAWVEGVGLCGPGLAGWESGRRILGGETAYVTAQTTIPAGDWLPPAERRRVGVPVRLTLAVGHEAFAQAGRDAAATATVLASSGGDCDNVHHLCESLATAEREVSPTRFHNSVHNAAAGYWGIATRSRAASTSLSAHDASFAAGLLEAATQVTGESAPVALIAYDHPYPEPLARLRPILAAFGVALVLAPEPTGRAFAALALDYEPGPVAATVLADPGLERARTGIPAGRSLPLLAALARGSRETVVLACGVGHLRVEVAPC